MFLELKMKPAYAKPAWRQTGLRRGEGRTQMKNIFCVMLVLFFVFACVTDYSVAEKNKKPQFSKEEKEALENIKKIKEFGKTIGLKETDKFTVFKDGCPYIWMFYFENNRVPNSNLEIFKARFDNMNELKAYQKKHGITWEKYNIEIYRGRATTGSSVITRDFLKKDEWEMVRTIVHEDIHDTLDLPVNFEEAVCHFVSYVAQMKYFKFSDIERDVYLKGMLLDGAVVKNVYKKHKALFFEYVEGKIDEFEFKEQEGVIFGRAERLLSGKFFFTRVAVYDHITYYRYFDIVYKLFYAHDANIFQLMTYLKGLGLLYPEPVCYTREECELKNEKSEVDILDFLKKQFPDIDFEEADI